MQGFDAQSAKQYILRHMDKRPFRSLANRLEEIVDDFITYDLHFMRLTGVLDEVYRRCHPRNLSDAASLPDAEVPEDAGPAS